MQEYYTFKIKYSSQRKSTSCILTHMTARDEPSSESELLFTEKEWDSAMPEITTAMMAHLKQYRTPIFIDHVDYGESWGSGSFIELYGRKYILTNEHVARIRKSKRLGFRLNGQADMPRISGNHAEQAWPWDLALLPVDDDAWSAFDHGSTPIRVDQLALAHTPCPNEIFAVAGFAGERTRFVFGEMHFASTTSLACEVKLVDQAEIDHRFHFGIAYRPDAATSVVGRDLPKPPGLSGSTVWNTCFVEARANGIEWTPDLAKVTGVVWGWPSGQGAIAATKVEHVRSFLLEAANQLGRS